MQLDLSGPTVATLKSEAKGLRQASAGAMTHAEALEALAHRRGARNWNTLRAAVARPVRLSPGDRVRGAYLGHAFSGEIRALGLMGGGSRMRVSVQFDEPVDVAASEAFSVRRRRVSAIIGADGRSLAQTSDRQPHLVLESVEP